MNKNILIAMAMVIGLVSIIGTINAATINTKFKISNGQLTIINDIVHIRDQVTCTCNGKACSSTQNGSPGASAGNILVNCARICQCSGKIGFTYEAED